LTSKGGFKECSASVVFQLFNKDELKKSAVDFCFTPGIGHGIPPSLIMLDAACGTNLFPVPRN
jgi:hypothetical protein